jgi:hypothetical protein
VQYQDRLPLCSSADLEADQGCRRSQYPGKLRSLPFLVSFEVDHLMVLLPPSFLGFVLAVGPVTSRLKPTRTTITVSARFMGKSP